MSLPRAHKCTELIQKFVRAQLVGIVRVEIGIERIEVIAQHGLGWLHATEQGYGPWPRAAATMRIADIRGQCVALMQFGACTFALLSRGCSFLGICRLTFGIAPFRIYKLAVNAKAHVVTREIVPDEPSARIVHIGLIVFQRKFVGNLALKIVGAFFTAVGNLPGFFVVIRSNRRHGPDVAVPRNFSTVVKIIKHAELQRELVLIGRDVFAVHGQRRISVSHF